MKKIISLVLALALVMSLAIGAAAEATVTDSGKGGSATITVTLSIQGKNTYKVYKVFDATHSVAGEEAIISYTVKSGKTGVPNVAAQLGDGYNAATTNHFVTDAAGNVHYGTETTDGEKITINDSTDSVLSDAAIKAIAAYVADEDLVATVTTTETDAEFTVTGLEYGYYYITTTTGSVVVVNSTNPNAEVTDKNTAPQVTKVISGASSFDTDGKKALAQLGTDVEFTATITVGAGAKGYVFHDIMDDGFTYNNDVKLYVDGQVVADTNYTTNKEETDTFTVQIKDDYIGTLAEGTEIEVKYSAKVNSDTLTTDPAENTAYVTYGDPSSVNKTTEAKTATYNAKMTVTKTDGNNNPLAGAGFVVSRQVTVGNTTVTQYYKLDNDEVSWERDIDDATEYTSDADGNVTAFAGLANGEYTLIEKTVPAGYNRAEDVPFTIAASNYESQNLEQTATVINQAGSVLPSTGGMGTTVFYILGGLMTVGALVLLVTKKRMADE